MSSMTSINIHSVARVTARVEKVHNCEWVSLEFESEDGSKFSLAAHCADADAIYAQLTKAPEFVDGVRAAAAMLDKKADDFACAHSFEDPETGVAEFKRGEQEDYYNTLRELADDIRSL